MRATLELIQVCREFHLYVQDLDQIIVERLTHRQQQVEQVEA
jgi:hypothetical protein